MKKPNRIYILGTAGSGKGWLAYQLSKKLNIPEYNLDDIFWYKKYSKKRKVENRIKKLKPILRKKKWILEGIYVTWTSEAIKKSDLVIWLDPPFRVLSWRIFMRYLKRKKMGEGDKFVETMNLIKYAGRYKKPNQTTSGYLGHKALIEGHKVKFIILRNKRQIKKWLDDF